MFLLCVCFYVGRKSRSSKASRGRSTESGLDGSTLSSLSGNQSSLGLLQGLLGQVETELDGLGPEEPPRAPGAGEGEGTTGPKHSTHGLTGFSVALVSTLGRLARLLRQVCLTTIRLVLCVGSVLPV